MNLINLFLRIERKLYYAKLEKKVGHKLNGVKVMGKVSFDNCELSIGDNVTLYPDVTFNGNGKIVIEDNVKIGKGVIIYANKNGGVTIGHHTIIAAQTYIIDTNHQCEAGQCISMQPLLSSPVSIGSDVWIGADSTIIKGARIGDGAVIGAKSLVNSDIANNAIAFGIPAKVRKYRE